MQKPQRNTAYWLALPGLLSLPSYSTQDYQARSGTTHHNPTSISSSNNRHNDKMYHSLAYRLAHGPRWWEHFLKGGSLSPNDSILGQADIKPDRTGG